MLKNTLKAVYVSKKDLLIYYSKGPVLIFGLLMPAFFFLAFSLGREMESQFLASGLIGMTLWFTSTSISPVITPWETWNKTLERLLTLPISISGIILGDIVASSILGITITGLATIILIYILNLSLNSFILFLIVLVSSSVCFSAIGSLMGAYPTDRTADVMMIATVVKFPIIFVSGIFISISDLPAFGQWIAWLSPLTYFVEFTRSTFQGQINLISMILIILLTIFFVSIAILAHKYSISKRIT